MMGPMFRYRLFSLLPRISLFGALSRKEVDFFIRPLRTQKIASGEVLFCEGAPPGDFHLILEGEIELSINGRRMTAAGEGELIGAEAAVGIQDHSMTATACTDCVLLVIPPRAIHRLAKERPEAFGLLMSNIARDFARRLSGISLFAGGRPQSGRRTTSSERGPSLPPTGDAGFRYPVTKPWPRMGRPLW